MHCLLQAHTFISFRHIGFPNRLLQKPTSLFDAHAPLPPFKPTPLIRKFTWSHISAVAQRAEELATAWDNAAWEIQYAQPNLRNLLEDMEEELAPAPERLEDWPKRVEEVFQIGVEEILKDEDYCPPRYRGIAEVKLETLRKLLTHDDFGNLYTKQYNELLYWVHPPQRWLANLNTFYRWLKRLQPTGTMEEYIAARSTLKIDELGEMDDRLLDKQYWVARKEYEKFAEDNWGTLFAYRIITSPATAAKAMAKKWRNPVSRV
jgi:hypothetical protein